ncbi:conserved hypothetical protein [Magnetospirillum sp. LM-5]|uniref:DUF1127 domain-containing protein n=1 Tax=Magnetospirillum sp. LM-5 TaxID=2681466 RepID=UPI001382D6F7|nr:DUF1127 domain-containing protein [Magnetospirillum sp. LM-5]CAA7616062.1 conserved hypothetical protein [Magnetospirillum sp. LM-5]
MSLSPAFGPCAPNPVCGPSPVPRRPATSLWQQAVSFLEDTVVRPVQDRIARDRLQSEMAGLDHRELKDLGLSEDEVPYFVNQWKPKH